MSAEGEDLYRCFVVPTNFDSGRFVTGIEVRPGNRHVVHHVIAYLDTRVRCRSQTLDGADGAPGYTSFGGPGFAPTGALGGFKVPGIDAQITPTAVGIWLPKGADIVLQVHYHRDGKPEEADQTQIGLTFAKGHRSISECETRRLGNRSSSAIKPGDTHYEVKASLTVPADVTVYDVLPHMHWLGHDMTVTATLPSGKTEQLVSVAPYDFNWQTRYTYREPVKLPKGTKLNLVSHYDNSSANIHNPSNPPKRVTFGEQTTNEMCFAFFTYSIDAEHITKGQRIEGAGFGDGNAETIVDEDLQALRCQPGRVSLNAKELAEVIKFFRSATLPVPMASNLDPDVGRETPQLGFYDKEKDGQDQTERNSER